MGAGVIAAGLGAIGSRRNQKKLNKLLERAPKYKINDEAYDNQAIAKSEAFGRDRSIQFQETQLEQDAANAVTDVKDVASSTNALLAAITAIKANQNTARVGLAQNEAQLMAQRKAQLIGVNNQMIDEKDKMWNYNENMPYQMKVAALRDRKKANDELFLKGVDNWAAEDSNRQGAVIGAVGSMFGGMMGK
jgi:hypothetical protein